jgi:hypothetical protein
MFWYVNQELGFRTANAVATLANYTSNQFCFQTRERLSPEKSDPFTWVVLSQLLKVRRQTTHYQ